jgi:hypothetical protein
MTYKEYKTECGRIVVDVDNQTGRARAIAVADPTMIWSWQTDLCWRINREEHNLAEAVEILGEAGFVLDTQQEDVR